jgi:hypothetical protein
MEKVRGGIKQMENFRQFKGKLLEGNFEKGAGRIHWVVQRKGEYQSELGKNLFGGFGGFDKFESSID